MKNVIFLGIVVLFVQASCFAQGDVVVDQQANNSRLQLKIATGEIEAITLMDAEKGIKAELVLIEENDGRVSFSVADGALIRNRVDKAVELDELKKGDLVKVVYRTSFAGVNTASVITLSE